MAKLHDRAPCQSTGGLALAGFALALRWQFTKDIAVARARVVKGSTLIDTPCGLIEYQVAGKGPVLPDVHGSGGGFDHALAFVMGGSAGALSALQMAIRHPGRVLAVILMVPLGSKSPGPARSAPPMFRGARRR